MRVGYNIPSCQTKQAVDEKILFGSCLGHIMKIGKDRRKKIRSVHDNDHATR